MKWIVLLLLAAGAYAYWAYTEAHPEEKACGHFAEVCGPDSKAECDEAFAGLAKVLEPPDLKGAAKCVGDAKSCSQATGCLAGGAGRAGLNTATDFFKGMGEALTK